MGYPLDLALSGLRVRHKRAHVGLARDFVGWLRFEFLGTAADLGLLTALADPRTRDELADELAVVDVELLDAFLAVGESVGVLVRRRGRWRRRGRRARAMVDPAVDGLAALPEEAARYGADVHLHLGERLAGAASGDYLDRHGQLVARSSRVAEVLFGPLVVDLVQRRGARRVLEVGCGSGVNLRHVAAVDGTSGLGVDSDAGVVSDASRNLATWGLTGRFSVAHADVRPSAGSARTPGAPGAADLTGPWDLVLLLQNLYYFAGDERAAVLRRLRALSTGGALLVATAVRGTGDPFAAYLDLVLRSTAGTTPLPTVDELRADVSAAGFGTVEVRRLAPFQPVRAVVAW